MSHEYSEGRILIRHFRGDEAGLLFEAVRESVVELSRWMAWCHPGYAREDSETFVRSRDAEWDKGEHYSFAIFDSGTGLFLGGAGLNFINRPHNLANLGYWVRTSQTGRGVAPTAARLVARFGLIELGFNRIEILTAVGNLASQRVAEKTGARSEGLLRKRLVVHDQTFDALMFSIVREDLKT
jgi:RimJ/RimL family protein N-acetyltransferase